MIIIIILTIQYLNGHKQDEIYGKKKFFFYGLGSII